MARKVSATSMAKAEATANEMGLFISEQESANRLAILNSIPDAEMTQRQNIFQISISRAFNFRADNSYKADENEELRTSLKTFGWLKRDYPVASRKADGTLQILAGHLRLTMARGIVEFDAEEATKNLAGEEKSLAIAKFKENHRLTYLSLLVYHNLDASQEKMIACDHFIKKGLSEAEKAKAIVETIESHREKNQILSDLTAGQWFGVGEKTVQRLRQAYCTPTYWKQYLLKLAGEECINPKQPWPSVLYKAYNEDRKAGCPYRTEGPNFLKAWGECVAFQGNADAAKTAKNDSRSKKLLTEQVEKFPAMFSDNNVDPSKRVDNVITNAARDIMLYCAGEDRPYMEAIQRIANLVNDHRSEIRDLNAELKQIRDEYKHLESANRILVLERDSLLRQIAENLPTGNVATESPATTLPNPPSEIVVDVATEFPATAIVDFYGNPMPSPSPAIESMGTIVETVISEPTTNGKAKKKATKPVA